MPSSESDISPPLRIAAVRYLNTAPLICALEGRADVRLARAVPAHLLEALLAGQADAALVPAIDLQRSPVPLTVLPAGCIASAGETLTVRVFSHVEPAEVTVLAADTESHTSVALAAVLWAQRFGRRLEIVPREQFQAACAHAVLLIGDKVVTDPPADCPHQADLGQMWFEMTRLPFVFAVWAARADEGKARHARLFEVLNGSRLQCAGRLDDLARHHGPRHGWPVDLARRYLTQHLQYEFTPDCRRGMEEFHRLAQKHGVIDLTRILEYFNP